AALRTLETSTPSMTNEFSAPLAPSTEYPPTPPGGPAGTVPVTLALPAPPPTDPALGSKRTPGAIWSTLLKLLPLGVLGEKSSEMLVVALLEVTAIVSALAVTVIDSDRLPAGSDRSIVSCFPSSSTMPSC